MCSATFIPAENFALLYLHALTAKWTTAIVSKFIAFLKADEKNSWVYSNLCAQTPNSFFSDFFGSCLIFGYLL